MHTTVLMQQGQDVDGVQTGVTRAPDLHAGCCKRLLYVCRLQLKAHCAFRDVLQVAVLLLIACRHCCGGIDMLVCGHAGAPLQRQPSTCEHVNDIVRQSRGLLR